MKREPQKADHLRPRLAAVVLQVCAVAAGQSAPRASAKKLGGFWVGVWVSSGGHGKTRPTSIIN